MERERRESELHVAVMGLTSQLVEFQRQQTQLIEQMTAVAAASNAALAAAAGRGLRPGPHENAQARPSLVSTQAAAVGSGTRPELDVDTDTVMLSPVPAGVHLEHRLLSASSPFSPESPHPSWKLADNRVLEFSPGASDDVRHEELRDKLIENRTELVEQREQLRETLSTLQNLQEQKVQLEETLRGTLVRTANVEANNNDLREFVGSLVNRISSLEGQLSAASPKVEEAETLLSDGGRSAGMLLGESAARRLRSEITPQVALNRPVSRGRGRGAPRVDRPPR